MGIDLIIVFALIFISILIFVFELLPIDVTAFMIMVVLLITGIITPQQGVMGFGNQATITIMALMIIGAGLDQTGAVSWMGQAMLPLMYQKAWLTIGVLMLLVGSVSAFISTTAVVIVFLRIMMDLSNRLPTKLSKILMPISFAGILGGSCTLMGTSTNLIVSSISKDFGYESFSLFEFSGIGAVFFVAGLIYMVVVGRHLLPDRQNPAELTADYNMKTFITALVVRSDSRLIGQPISETLFLSDDNYNLLSIEQQDGQQVFPDASMIIKVGDVLYVQADVEKIKDLYENENLKFLNDERLNDKELSVNDLVLCEVLILPNSRLSGKSLNRLRLNLNFHAIPLAVHKGNKYFSDKLEDLNLTPGDTILMETTAADLIRFKKYDDLIVLSDVQELKPPSPKRYLSIAIVGLVVLLAAFNILPIMISALLGCLLMFLTKCVDPRKAYRNIDWSIIFLLAGMIPLGSAMSNTGADQMLAELFVLSFEGLSPMYFIGALFIFTTLLSSVISNNATAILLAPIAISIATQLALPVKPFLVVVMFAANISFMTPIGYQTNTLIYGPGNYRFKDFFVVGGLLTLIICILAAILIPYFYF